MAKIFPIVKKTQQIISGVQQANAVWAETPKLDDGISLIRATGDPEELNLASQIGQVVLMDPTGYEVDDTQVSNVQATKAAAEIITGDDSGKMTVSLPMGALSRTATPATDLVQDSYVQQDAATSNFGTSPNGLVQATGTLGGNNAKQTYFQIDLTRFAGCTADPDFGAPFTFGFSVIQDGLTEASFQWILYRQGAKPFTEDTVNWNTRPTGGTQVKSATVAVGTGSTSQGVNVTLSAAQLDQCLSSGWIYILCQDTANGLLRPTFTIRTREQSFSQPRLTLQLIRS